MKRDRKYRIGMVAACPFPSLRGSQALVRELAEALASRGHDVHVVTYPSAQHMAPVERISIHRAARVPGVRAVPPAIGWQKVVLDFVLVWTLWRVARAQRLDVIHAHNVEAPLAAFIVRLLTGIPVVYHAHNAMSDELPHYFAKHWCAALAARFGRALDRALAKRADYTIAVTSRLGAYLAVRGAAMKTAVIAPAITCPGQRKNDVPHSEASLVPRIVYAGNLDRYQNIDCLLSAFDRVCAEEPRANLVFALHETAGTARATRNLVGRPGVSVRVERSLGGIARELREADALVCPRTSWSGFPIKVLNYMAASRPVIQARSSAHAIEHERTGLVFEDDDPVSMSKSILRVIRDRALAERLGDAARKVVASRYSWSRVVPQVEAVYHEVAQKEDWTQARKEKTLVSGGDRIVPMAQSKIRKIATTVPRAREKRPIFAMLVAALLISACAGERREAAVAPLPPIAAPALPGATRDGALYQIQPGDQLRVKFLFHPELDVKVPVSPDGVVFVPGVGEVAAEGKTAEVVAAEIERLSSDQLRDPEVTVIVAEFGDRVVYVGGEVRLPGPVRFREGMTPLQAILDRGGFTEVARVDSVLHLSPNGSTYSARRLDYTTDVNSGDPELATMGVYDVVFVPRTFIGDANAFVRLYIRGLLPTMPRVGVGFQP